jgi:hypothetical protein
MNEDFQEKLERRIHQHLHQLAPLKAPKTFTPRVLSMLEARQRLPWWRKSWTGWSFGVRLLVFTLLLSVAGIGGYAGMQIDSGLFLESLLEPLVVCFSSLEPFWNVLAALGNATLLLLRSGGHVLLWIMAAVAALMYLTCVGLGTVCYRVAVSRI